MANVAIDNNNVLNLARDVITYKSRASDEYHTNVWDVADNMAKVLPVQRGFIAILRIL